jgi:hypothetical protein
MMIATATTISSPARTVRAVIASFRMSAPSRTAPTGVT